MLKRSKKSIGVLFVSFFMMFTLAACGGDETSEGELQDSYVVVSDTSFVPFEFYEDGEYVGFDIDLINAVADEVGFEIEMETTNFDGIIPGLQTGSFDIAIAGISIREDRKESVDFSDPYYESGLRIGVHIDNDDIHDVDDLEGKTIATRLGSTSADYIEDNIEGAEANQYEQLDQAYLAVENGSVDAILYDAPNVAYYIQTQGEDSLKMVGDLYQAENYGIAISKGQEELVDAINDALETLRDDGTYDEIYEKWFGDASE
ncbi:transporter substrate-binding domain-containing protein [Virgibacillus oceani]